MRKFFAIVKKEHLEYWRNFSWVWVPVVFILLAIMDPLTTHFLPIILDALGGMPDGTIFEIPEVLPPDALMMSLVQFSSFGVLIIVLLTMGTIAGERKSGIAELVLVKPVKYSIYITAKWLAKLTLFLTAFMIAMLVSWYYVNLLFGTITFAELVYVIFFYSIWIIFVVSLTIFYNTIFKKPGLVGAITIATIMVMSLFNSIFAYRLKLTWFPNNLSSYIREMLHSGQIPSELWGTALVAIALSVCLLLLSYLTFQKKELAES